MTAAPVIRPMAAGDRETVVDLLHQLNLVELALTDTRSDRREHAAECLDWNGSAMAEHGGAHLVAEMEGAVVAYMALVVDMAPPFVRPEWRRHLRVAELVVDERRRGQGLGQAMLDAAERFARERGLKHILIGVTAGNDGADRLYARNGFRLYGLERLRRLG